MDGTVRMRFQSSASIVFKGLKMTRLNDSDRNVGRTLGSVALCAVLVFFAGDGAEAAQNRSTGLFQSPAASQQQQQIQARQAQQYRQAQIQAQAQRQTNQTASRTPILSGIFGQNKSASSGGAVQNEQRQVQIQTPAPRRTQESQEPQHLGVFGTRPLLSGLKNQDFGDRQARERQSQEFHAQSQHLNESGQNVFSSFGQRADAPFRQGAVPSDLTQASTNPAEAGDALAKIPWNLFPEKTKARFQQIASSPTMYRRLPMAGGRCNPELFDFFLTYPNTIIELWKQMGYDEVDMKQVGPATYAVSEKDGSSGKLTILFQTTELAVAHVAGVYRGPGMIRPVEGEAFLILQVRYTEDQTLTPLVVCRLDAFVDVKNPGADLVARAFNSMIGKIADTNFEQTLAFVDSVSQTVENDPRQFQSVVARLTGLSSEARRILADKAMTVALQAQQRESGKSVDYRLLAKANDPNPGYARILARGGAQSAANNPSYAASTPKSSFQGYQSPEVEDDFFDSNDMNASFAESGFHIENKAPTTSFGQTRGLPIGFGDDFSLASDDASDYEFEVDDEVMMTGEEYLATQSLSTPDSDDLPNSLAKVGSIPSQNARARKLVETEATPLAPYSAASSALSTDDDLVIDSFNLEDDDSAAPQAIPLSRPSGAPKLPSTVLGFNAAKPRPGAQTAASLVNADETEQYGDVAEITLDEDGNPILEFTDVDENENENEPQLALPESSDDVDVEASFAPLTVDPEGDDEIEQEEPDEEDVFEAGGWTRSAFANRNVSEKVALKTSRTSSDDETLPERPKLATRRYAPPLEKSNGASPVKTMAEAKANDSGDRVATYRWSPVPGAFVAKTAALPREENTLSPKTAKFAKPEIRR